MQATTPSTRRTPRPCFAARQRKSATTHGQRGAGTRRPAKRNHPLPPPRRYAIPLPKEAPALPAHPMTLAPQRRRPRHRGVWSKYLKPATSQCKETGPPAGRNQPLGANADNTVADPGRGAMTAQAPYRDRQEEGAGDIETWDLTKLSRQCLPQTDLESVPRSSALLLQHVPGDGGGTRRCICKAADP